MTSLGAAATVHLACAVDNIDWGVSLTHFYLAEDVVRNGEGVRHVIRVAVSGAPEVALARALGKAVVNASNSLAVDISGAGKVEYLGEPKLRQTISGIGKIARRDGG